MYSVFRTGDATVDRNLDAIQAELSKASFPINTSPKRYTPRTQGLGSITEAWFTFQVVGATLHVRGTFRVGTPTAEEARIGLPPNMIAGSSDLLPPVSLAGYSTYGAATGSTFAPTVLIQPSATYFTLGGQSIGIAGLTPQNGDAILPPNELYSFFASCPIKV